MSGWREGRDTAQKQFPMSGGRVDELLGGGGGGGAEGVPLGL
jgi:hypothetical protein